MNYIYFLQKAGLKKLETNEDLSKFKNHPNIKSITPLKEEKGKRDTNIFPQNPDYNWNNDQAISGLKKRISRASHEKGNQLVEFNVQNYPRLNRRSSLDIFD